MKKLLPNKLARCLTIILVLCLISACREQIIHDLSESEANRLVTKLGAASINAEKIKQADSRWALAVPDSQALQALSYLSATRVLREGRTPLVERSPFTTPPDEQRFVLQRKLSAEIEDTLATVSGILEARVHLNLPPVDPLFGKVMDEKKGTASVLLVVEQDATVERDAVAALVAGASGIAKEKIAVLVSRSERSSQPIPLREVVNAAPAAEPVPVVASARWDLAGLQGAFMGLGVGKIVGAALAGVLMLLGVAFYSQRRLRRLIAFQG